MSTMDADDRVVMALQLMQQLSRQFASPAVVEKYDLPQDITSWAARLAALTLFRAARLHPEWFMAMAEAVDALDSSPDIRAVREEQIAQLVVAAPVKAYA